MSVLRYWLECTNSYLFDHRPANLPGLPEGRARKLVRPDCRNRGVVLCLDVSGSMGEKDYPPCRLAAAKKASEHFLTKLRETKPQTSVGVVSFASCSHVQQRPVQLIQGMNEIRSAVDHLSINGGTNIGEGLNRCWEVIRESRINGHWRVLLLTDGHHIEGPEPLPIAKALKQRGVQLDIIGIGGSPADVNEEELRQMASLINDRPRYWFIDSAHGLEQHFERLALKSF